MEFDYSTIDREKLGRLPQLKLPPTFHLSRSRGNGCFMDPPGYPTYFTQSVFTGHGNSPPRKGQATLVLLGHVVCANYESLEEVDKRLRGLWAPLPIDHRRVAAWISECYKYFHACYSVPDILEYGRPKTLTMSCDFAHRKFKDDPRFSDEWRAKERAAVDAYNVEQTRQWNRIAIPDNHQAVRFIRKYYPEHAAIISWIGVPPASEGDWWSVYATRPSPEECPGEARWENSARHPVNGSWCQVCGWHAETD